jgi:hypothetical protein
MLSKYRYLGNYLSHFGSPNSSQDISAHKASDTLSTVSGLTHRALHQIHIITNAMRHGLSTAVHTGSPVIKEYETLHCAVHKPAITEPLASQSISKSSPVQSSPSPTTILVLTYTSIFSLCTHVKF